MVKRRVSALFPSITQPLRQSILVRSGLSAKDLEFDKKKIWVMLKAILPQKSAPLKRDSLFKKYEELEKLEKNNLEIIAGISMILSQTGFQKLFNPVEVVLIRKASSFMNGFVQIRTRLLINNATEGEKTTAIDKIEKLYSPEYLKIQKQMVMFFPELFALMQVFKNPYIAKKMAAYFERESRSMGKREVTQGVINDPREFILGGDILSVSVQCINRRALLLREIIAQTREDSQDELRLKNIYENAEETNLFAQEIMQETDRIAIEVNHDPFCLRELLCEDETYQIMVGMIKKKDKKRYEAISFLRDLSLLIKDGCFLTDGFENTGRIIAFALKHASSHSREIRRCIQSGSHIALIEALIVKAEQNLELVGPILAQFSTSKYFISRAKLAQTERETDEKYRYRLKQKISHGGEWIELFCIAKEENKKWKPIRPSSQVSLQKQGKDRGSQKKGILEVLGLMAPFLVLAAIPVVGFPLSLAVFSILGLASLAYYMAPEKKKKREEKTEKDSMQRGQNFRESNSTEAEVVMHMPRLENRNHNAPLEGTDITGRRRQSSVVIGERKSLYDPKMKSYMDAQVEKKPQTRVPKKEANLTYGTEVVEEISFLHRMESSVEAKTVLGGGMWIVEDRKRRNRMLNKDEMKMANPISASDIESSKASWFSDGNCSGYESFPEFDDEIDNNEPVDISQRYRHG